MPAIAGLARLVPAEVVVVLVPDFDGVPYSADAAAVRMRGVAQRLKYAGVGAHGEVLFGHAPPEPVAALLAGRVREMRAAMVVVGSHGHAVLTGLVPGRVARSMVALIDCPVVVMKGGHHDPAGEVGVERIRRVLVAVDESHESDAAVDATRMVAAEHSAAVLVMHARREAGTALIGSQTHALVESAARKLRGAGGPVLTRIHCTSEAVGASLAAAADDWSADLIVLGARRVTDLGGLLLGSVARDLMWRTRRPVLLAERTGRWSRS